MCGIAGIISPNGFEQSALRAMSHALEHRGPDGFGYSIYSGESRLSVWHNQEYPVQPDRSAVVGFVHRRLAIIDLSADGLQPMTNESGDLSVIYNGEIYNYLELRLELEGLGYRFSTNSDTEVLLQAYSAWGPECLRRFNGMWAFALLDLKKRMIFLSRDRFGIKPLYYSIQNRTLTFASEIKALLAVPAVPCVPNEKIVGHYLLTELIDHTLETFFEGIYQFPAAHWAEVSLDDSVPQVKPQKYWAFPLEIGNFGNGEMIDEFRSLFLDALRLHARSDVPVGTCLSGGLDSSAIVCGSELLRSDDLIPHYSHTAYGYCASDDQFSEKQYMQAVIDATSARMEYIEIAPDDFLNTLSRVIREQDEPFGSASIIAQWYVFQRAHQTGMTVMLDGQGADEIMGGYHYYFHSIARSLLLHDDISGLLSLRKTYQKVIGQFPFSIHPVSLIYNILPAVMRNYAQRQRVKLSAQKVPLSVNIFGSMALSKRFIQSQVHSLPELTKYDSLEEHLRADVQSRSLPALLRYEDRNSMAHSIEARVPFLDYRLVEFLFKIPEQMKVRGVSTKYILREAFRDIIPGVILDRKDKIGFKAAPHLTLDLIDKIRSNLIENQTEYEQRWFDPNGLERIFHPSYREISTEFDLWRIVNLKLWARQFWGHN
jgi:asparagine synthase (glutamine-hydrolysing)